MRFLAAIVRSGSLFCIIACALASAAFIPMAQAGAKRKPSVLVVHTVPSFIGDVQAKLSSSGLFAAVDLFNAAAGTPTLAALKAYDAVLVASNNNFSNPVTLGNNLADYVDAGGGVVNAAYSVGSFSPPAGRWNPGYVCMSPGAGIANTGASLDLSSITDQNHAILIGVGALSTQFGYRINQNSVVAGATVVARWTGGNVFVASGPLPGRVDLNLDPLSKDVNFGGWNPATDDGVKLMVNSLLYVMRPKVLLVYADSFDSAADVKAKIKATNALGQIDLFDAYSGTPTLAQLQAYDAVLTWSSASYSNSAAIGNALADFADAGGGVVVAIYANITSVDGTRLGGRWVTGGYEIIPGASGGTALSSETLGAVAYPSHPIMSGVTSFNGGFDSVRPISTALNPGGLIVAKWSDGKTLAAVSTKLPNRADLGFAPPSDAATPYGWVTGTDGHKLMANALIYTVKPYVGCIFADPDAGNDVPAKLIASRRFSGVASIDVRRATPALSTISPLNAVATWTNFFKYSNSTTLGNTLADYVDAGGGVVIGLFANTNDYSPGGRWVTQGYEVVPSPLPGTGQGDQAYLGAVLEPTHPIASFVRRFDGGSASFRLASVPLLRGRTIMNWTGGKMLASVHNFKKRADLGFYPVSNAAARFGSGWNQRTDGTWMTANALEFVVRAKPCPGDFNGDGQVDDTDFSLFVGYYDTLLDPRGDLTGDGNTEDADFSVFVGGYNNLVCP